MTGGMPEAAGDELADVAIDNQRRTEATWQIACHARDEADFRWLCEAADVDVSREALAAVRAQFGRKTRTKRRRP